MIGNQKSRRNEIVGTTNISIAAIPSAWLRRNVLQPWDGGSRRLTMYLATLVCPISMPSLRSSPWIRGAPHRGLAMLISRISLRIFNGTVGLCVPKTLSELMTGWNRLSWWNDRAVLFRSDRAGLAVQVEVTALGGGRGAFTSSVGL